MLQILLFVSFCLLIFIANALFSKSEKKNREAYKAFGGIIFIFALTLPLSVTYFSIFNNYIVLPFWPTNTLKAVGILIVFYFFARSEMVSYIFKETRDLEKSISTFFGPIGIHFSSMLLTIGILFPWLKIYLPLPLSIFLAALSFPAYHFCQYYFFKKGTTFVFQFQLFAFSLGYILLYELTNSFIIVFVLQHCIATTTFIYNKDYDFGERDFPFYFGIIVVTTAIVVARIYLK